MATFKQIAPSKTIVSPIIITEPKIIHFIPDFDSNFLTFKDNFPFTLTNIQSVVIKSNMIRIGSIGLNPRQYAIDVKKNFPKTVLSFPDTIINNKFIIVDHSVIITAINTIAKTSERRALFLLFNYLKNEFVFSKSIFPNSEHLTSFIFNNNGLYELIYNNINTFKSKTETLRFFDHYVLATADNLNIPFIYYKSADIFIDVSALKRLEKTISAIDNSIVPITAEQPTQNASIVDVQSIINNDNLPETAISSEILDNVIKTQNISNKNVESNIKLVINSRLKDNPNITKDELNLAILKTVNKTIFGTDVVKQEYLDNPKLLLNKLSVFDEYSDAISNVESKDGFISSSPNIVRISNITGPIRHKYEFSNNIHMHVEKLFKTLEDKVNPIEVLNIKHEVKDNNVDRYIAYEITLKNKSGGLKEPYTIKLNVPYLINDRYFKLNGKEYILSSQQFLTPLTKNTSTEARFLSHFSMVTEKLVNFKYSPSDIPSLMDYINRTYSSAVHKYDPSINKIEFNDGSIINLSDSIVPFSHYDTELVHDHGKYFIYKNGNKIDTPIRKIEFIYEHIFNIINSINPNDSLKNSSRSVQYVEIHVMGPHIPLILVLWQQLGLIDALLKLELNFEIADVIPTEGNFQHYTLKDDKFLIIYPKSKRDEYVANGLLKLPFLSELTSTDLNKKESSYEFLTTTYGTKIINNLDGMVENAIDPTTKELLEFYNLPTNIVDIISGPLLDKLFNDEPDHPSDLSSLRVRMSEYMTQLMYTEIDTVSLYSNI